MSNVTYSAYEKKVDEVSIQQCFLPKSGVREVLASTGNGVFMNISQREASATEIIQCRNVILANPYKLPVNIFLQSG